jgi:competence protein ComEC
MSEQVGTRPRAAVWPPDPMGWWPQSGRPWTAGLEHAAEHLQRAARLISIWSLAELAPGRLVPWLAVAFGAGTILYFGADREPTVWGCAIALSLACAGAYLARARPAIFPLAVALAALTAGFATGTFKRALIAHPVLQATVSNVSLEGFIETREERERSDRIVVHVTHIEGRRLDDEHPLARVRLAVSNGAPRQSAGAPPLSTAAVVAARKRSAPPVGSFVRLKARLLPPLEPVRPGGYDFGRDMYFQHVV